MSLFQKITKILEPFKVALLVLIAIISSIFFVASEHVVNFENIKSLFELSKNIQLIGFFTGILLGILVLLLIQASVSLYKNQKGVLKTISKLENTSERYNPDNEQGVFKPIRDKADFFISNDKSPLVTLVNKAQFQLTESKKALDEIANFKLWGDSWQSQATTVLKKVETMQNIIVAPEDYIKFLNTYNTKECHLKIMGSMAGFLCLFPLSLRNFICAAAGNVTIDIIGTGIKVGEHNLALYPLAFVAKTMVSLFDLCDSFQCKNKKVTFNIYHYPFDIIEAIFIISDKKLINVQALSPNNIDVVFDNGQLGIVFSKLERSELFDRYDRSFENIKNKLEIQHPKPKETWELYKNNTEWQLSIKGLGHWKLEDRHVVFNENEELTNINFQKLETTQNVTKFLYEIYDDASGIYKQDEYPSKTRYLKNECSQFHSIDKKLRDKPGLSKIPCSCGWDKYNLI